MFLAQKRGHVSSVAVRLPRNCQTTSRIIISESLRYFRPNKIPPMFSYRSFEMFFSWVFLKKNFYWKRRLRHRSLRRAHEGEQSQKRFLWRRVDAEGVDKRVKNKRFPAEEMDCSLFLSAYPQRLGCKDCLKAKSRNARKGRNSCCWIVEKTLKGCWQ